MSGPSPEDALRVQQLADAALEEVATRAEDDGVDPVMLHSAFCVSSAGWLANAIGPEKAAALLTHLAASLTGEPPKGSA